MEQRLLTYKSSEISYYRYGTGDQSIICFHGYGENAESYGFLETYTGNQFSFYSIDLPFHGKTEWKETSPLKIDDLVAIVRLIAGETKPVILMGYSLGGRMALGLLEKMPAQTQKLVLLAPDGLKVNFWYRLSTQTWLGNRLFALTMRKPQWFFGFLKLLDRLKLINASIFKFVHYYIDDKEARELLYKRWTGLRKIKPHIPVIKSLITTNNIPVRLIYGKHDRIILPARGEKFRKGIENLCQINIIHSGHQVLHKKHVEEILPALQQ